MTGGTLIVRKGTRYVMTKVAHDGYDIEDHIAALVRFAVTSASPETVTKEYLRLRGGGDFEPYDPLGKDEELCRIARDYDDAPSADDAIERMEQEIIDFDGDDEHPYMQLGCSYCDYVTFIDMNRKIATINGEEV